MKISDKIISIPPYISTTWDKVSSLHMQDKFLIVILKEGSQISIPNLTDAALDEIFHAHTLFLEHTITKPVREVPSQQLTEQISSMPFRLIFGTLESLGQALAHNPANSNLPPLPQEIVQKILMFSKSLPQEEMAANLHPVSGCNCIYCQIGRIIKGETETHVHEESGEDEVKEEDLRFEQWEVTQISDKMYQVTNKLDPNEHYSVFLGEPIGCTCGKPNCEHIVAVLRH